MWRKLAHDERGYTLVTVALLLLFVVVPLLALVVDIGYAYVQEQRMQTAADAAALAGTRVLDLTGDEGQAEYAARQYAERNGAANVIAEADLATKKVRVTKAERSFPSFFPTVVQSILGRNTYLVHKPAAAVHGPVVAIPDGGVYPIAIDDYYFPFEEGEIYDIYVGTQPGNFGWLSWNGTMSEGYLATCLSSPAMSAGYINPVTGQADDLEVGKWVWGRPGIANSVSVRDALDYLKNNQIPIIIVVWDQTRLAGSDAQYHIRGFAEFILTDYSLPGQNRISGKFRRSVPTVKVVINEHADAADFGLHGVKLTE